MSTPSPWPELQYPPELPVVQRREEILRQLAAHPVLILCGETGSGKTTQLPKMCLEAGSARRGAIAHTQPRRLAARAVATRLAEELRVPLGTLVGFKVRFDQRTSRETLIRVMTDGILLAELRHDPELRAYDTLIIDEAHERSLNIDFLLGYLKRLRRRRPDLRIVITSATIDPHRFSAFFDDAPIIEVSGRGYPVETRYRPLVADKDDDLDPGVVAGVLAAVEEITTEPGEMGEGDVLVFLPGEREIRETAEALTQSYGARLEVLPLYSRLSWSDQQRVFSRSTRRRIVLATNVAETSITVPGIRAVIDSGLARISRYSPRSKILRLPIEPISQASADQRRGRCGRVGPGLCLRLYAEVDYMARAAFTPPEVMRTNLASVILQMAALKLGSPLDFPFIDPPETRLVSDGYRLLQELEAVGPDQDITTTGRQMSRLPVDPRVARMLVEARRRGCLQEMIVVAAGLSIQDPRERPAGSEAQADQRHARFAEPRSDFATLLKLWTTYVAERVGLTRSAQRRWCREQFLSAIRMREWEDLQNQLRDIIDALKWPVNEVAATPEALSRSVLAGLLSNIGTKDERGEYRGARGLKFVIAPGTPLRARAPQWLMAAQITETQRVYARLVAAVDAAWIEAAAQHLVKRSYSDPEWEPERGYVAARETVTLFGLIIAAGRRVNFGAVAPAEARQIFALEALVHGHSVLREPFLERNRSMKALLAAEEAKLRRHTVLIDEPDEAALYLARLPPDVHSVAAFKRWWREAVPSTPALLDLTATDLRRADAPVPAPLAYPDTLRLAGNDLPVQYRFEPGAIDDGVTVIVPAPLLAQIRAVDTAALIPGMRVEMLTALIRGLPKGLRRHLVPAPDVAARCAEAVAAEAGEVSFLEAVAIWLSRHAQESIDLATLAQVPLAEHLRLNLRIMDANDRVVAEGRDVVALRRALKVTGTASSAGPTDSQWRRAEVRDWDFGDLPAAVEVTQQGVRVRLFPAIIDRGSHAALELLDEQTLARLQTRRGIVRLLTLQLTAQYRHLLQTVGQDRELLLLHQPIGQARELTTQIADRAVERACLPGETLPASRATFDAALTLGKPNLVAECERLAARVRQALLDYPKAKAAVAALPPGTDRELRADLAQQLTRLVFPGFVAATPDPWLDSLPRFLQAIMRRAQKFRGMNERAAQQQLEYRGWWARYGQLGGEFQQRGIDAANLEELRWLLEEYGVSLFAQELRTRVPVSAQRLEREWLALRKLLQ